MTKQEMCYYLKVLLEDANQGIEVNDFNHTGSSKNDMGLILKLSSGGEFVITVEKIR